MLTDRYQYYMTKASLVHLVIDTHSPPIWLHQPPPSCHVNRVPTVPVGRVNKFFPREVTARLAIALDHLQRNYIKS